MAKLFKLTKLLRFSVVVYIWVTMPATGAYKVVILHPTGFDWSHANGVSGGQQVGYGSGIATGGREHALLWSSTAASYVDLNPTGFDSSRATGVSGGKHVGYGKVGYQYHALLWSGTVASYVDLNPSGFDNSFAYGISGDQQVGYWTGISTGYKEHALLWSGTAASYIDLNPSGFTESVAWGVSGGQQVGWGSGSTTGNKYHALLWSGTSASYIDLNPSGFTASYGTGVSSGLQVGHGYGSATGGWSHALLWSGTAASYIDLNPSGFNFSVGYGVFGSHQVGCGYGSATGGWRHALLWSGTAASYIDLHSFLPAGYDSSQAFGIDSAGNIVGYATTSSGANHAVLWEYQPPTTPTVVTEPATNVGRTSATLWAQIINDGGEACQCRFVCWTSDDFDDYGWGRSLTTGQLYQLDIDDLKPGTLYYFQAFAKNSAGETEGNVQSFTTLPGCEGTVLLLDPNGGEELVAGSTYEITWQTTDTIENVLIEYSTNNGTDWTAIGTVGNTGSYGWQVPQVNSQQCLVRITDVPYPDVNDTSDDVFTIYKCTLAHDSNHDGFVDILDFVLFASEWLQCDNPFDLAYDLNQDGCVDFFDLSLLTTEWLQCGNPFDPNCQP